MSHTYDSIPLSFTHLDPDTQIARMSARF